MSLRRFVPVPLGLAALLALQACESSEAGPGDGPPIVSAPRLPAGDLAQTVAADQELSTLGRALAEAHLSETLSAGGPYTLFAPSDEAFSRLPAATRDALLQPENRAMLAQILSYHIVPGVHPSEAFAGRQLMLRTVEGRTIQVDGNAGPLAELNGIVHVVGPDIEATNGVVHVIDTVLAPPTPPLKEAPSLSAAAAEEIGNGEPRPPGAEPPAAAEPSGDPLILQQGGSLDNADN